MKKLLIALLGCTMFLSSCGVTYQVNTALSQVEIQNDSIGVSKDTLIIESTYEDENISILWAISEKDFSFILKNKTSESLVIPWDNIVYVNPLGSSQSIIHSGIRYIERYNHQVESVVPSKSTIQDVLQPADNIEYLGYFGVGWIIGNLFTINKDNYVMSKEVLIGKSMGIFMPLIIKGQTKEYFFKFEIKDIVEKKK